MGQTEFVMSSSAFKHMGDIPSKYTCEGEDVAPPLSWTPPPVGTQSFVLISDDPDAPGPHEPNRFTWDHWIVFNIPATARGIPEGGKTPAGAVDGKNSWGRGGYGGPCPPIGKHRYFFKLYALDATLPLKSGASKAEIEKAMKGHILKWTELVGLYQKQKKQK